MQKIGFYYDHRENRYQLTQILNRLNYKYENALDLFSYVGAWGMAALKSGAKNATFVDQGDFNIEIDVGLELNGFKGQGRYLRSDVFKFLDEEIRNKNEYDLILCDPPAFAKSYQQKNQALEGYSKLHRKVFKAAKAGALIAFSSCTHYVTHDEFQKNISEAALKESKKIQLLYSGIQGWDHPVSSQLDKSNYIKCYFYLLES
jgi:23S rRNA (cytosine1962-C5)-methyltransferase